MTMKLPCYEFNFPQADVVNAMVLSDYFEKLQANAVRKTHLFAGRYENIYINREEIAGLSALIPFWIDSAAQVLERNANELRCGFWFNDMRPGDVTQPHSHDDDDEWLSAVYYLKVPRNSGDLVVHVDGNEIVVEPEAGKLVLFASSNVHEVTENLSARTRLSIGINFGRADR